MKKTIVASIALITLITGGIILSQPKEEPVVSTNAYTFDGAVSPITAPKAPQENISGEFPTYTPTETTVVQEPYNEYIEQISTYEQLIEQYGFDKDMQDLTAHLKNFHPGMFSPQYIEFMFQQINQSFLVDNKDIPYQQGAWRHSIVLSGFTHNYLKGKVN